MARLLWLAVAGGVTILVVRRDSRLTVRLSDGVVATVTDLVESVAAFGSEVRAGMTLRERELRQAAGLSDRPVA
jgi:hypothetical protein